LAHYGLLVYGLAALPKNVPVPLVTESSIYSDGWPVLDLDRIPF